LLLNIKVNGEVLVVEIDPSLRLIDLLREHLGLTGTNSACDTAQCGACTVTANGLAVKSCNVLALQMRGRDITTIEGLSKVGEPLHVMQMAFSQHHGLQCGYCTPGFVMRALSGNLCRCTGYEGIVAAVCEGLTKMRAEPAQSA
jgi:aerobic carbon-monoxide dehydrogenase small subunit